MIRRWRGRDEILRVSVTGLRSTRGEGSTAARVVREGGRFRAKIAVGAEGRDLTIASGNTESWAADAAELWISQNVVGCWPHGGVVIEGTRDVEVFERALASVDAAQARHAA